MHCAAHVIAIIIIAIVVISMIMNHALLVTKLLSVSVVQDEVLHRWSQLSLGPRYLRKSLGPRSTDGPRGEEEEG